MTDRVKVNFGNCDYITLMDEVGKWILDATKQNLITIHSIIVTKVKLKQRKVKYNCVIYYSYEVPEVE